MHLLSAVPWPDTSPGGSSGTGRAPRAPEGVGQASLLPDSPHRPTAALCGMSGDASSRQRQERALPRGARPAHAGPGVLGAHRACRCPAPAPLPPPPRSQEPQRPPGTAAGMWGAHGLPSHTGPWPWLDGHGPQLPPALHLPTAAGCRPESRRGGASMGPHARTRTLLLTGTAPTSPTRALHAQRPSLLPLPPAVCARGLGPPRAGVSSEGTSALKTCRRLCPVRPHTAFSQLGPSKGQSSAHALRQLSSVSLGSWGQLACKHLSQLGLVPSVNAHDARTSRKCPENSPCSQTHGD